MAARLLTAARQLVVGAWRALDFTRRLLMNGLLLLLLGGLAWWAWRPAPLPLAPQHTLVLDLKGPVREQFSGSLRDNALRQARGQPAQQTRLRDVLAALQAAAADPAVARVLLLTDDFGGAGPATLRELGAALQRVRASGKPVWAWAERYSQAAYAVAAQADQVFLDPMGAVSIEGYGGQRTYFREAFERFGISAHVLRAGAYKNAGETWVASGPSRETLEAERGVLDALWALYTGSVEQARRLPEGALAALVNELPQRLAAVQGDAAMLAQQQGLVDGLKTRDQMNAMLSEGEFGVRDGKSFRQLGLGEYLARLRPAARPDVIGVVVAEGAIRDGEAAPGAVGGHSTAQLIRQAREDTRVKALVLRIDSPGGSATASEQIRRELALTREAGKPVVVSMGDLAASGGYWVALAADEVIADAATITGSIGVVAMFPGFDQAMAKLGLRSGGYATTWLAGASDPRLPLDPRLAQLMQSGIDHVYARFTGQVAAARQRSAADIEAVAQGRIWTGAQAQAHGLVDRLGSFGDAIQAAAQRAGLAADGWQLAYIEVQPGRLDSLLGLLMSRLGLVADNPLDLAALLARSGWLPALEQEAAAWLDSVDRPGAAMVHCLCRVP